MFYNNNNNNRGYDDEDDGFAQCPKSRMKETQCSLDEHGEMQCKTKEREFRQCPNRPLEELTTILSSDGKHSEKKWYFLLLYMHILFSLHR